MPIEDYHFAWLSVHPNRSLEWLKERMKDGFHIHHLDGDHGNNAPGNLVLIEGMDHFRLHGRNISVFNTKRRDEPRPKMRKRPEKKRRKRIRLSPWLRLPDEMDLKWPKKLD
jgi:hypothetical protein